MGKAAGKETGRGLEKPGKVGEGVPAEEIPSRYLSPGKGGEKRRKRETERARGERGERLCPSLSISRKIARIIRESQRLRKEGGGPVSTAFEG